MNPFFGETYDLERIHYITSSILDSIDLNEPYSQDNKWATMIKKNVIDLDSTAYYLPKDVNALLNPNNNVYNKIGFSIKYLYKFRNYIEHLLEINLMHEIETENPITYYSLGMNIKKRNGSLN